MFNDDVHWSWLMFKPGIVHKNCGEFRRWISFTLAGCSALRDRLLWMLLKETPLIVAINRGPDIPEYISQYIKCQRIFFWWFLEGIEFQNVSKVSFLMVVGWNCCLELLEIVGMDSWFNDTAENMMLSLARQTFEIEKIVIFAYWVHITNRDSFRNLTQTQPWTLTTSHIH